MTDSKKTYNKKAETAKKAASCAKKTIKKAANTLTNIAASIKYDVKAVRERDPAAKSDAEVLLLYSGMHALLAYRVSHFLHEKKLYLPARAVSQLARFTTGIEIHPGAKIGKGATKKQAPWALRRPRG